MMSGERYKQKIAKLFQGRESVPPDDTIQIYNQWSEDYEQDVLGAGYMAHKLCASYFHKHAQMLSMGRDSRLLDVACGTGLVGKELKALGYTRIDGTDVCEAMLAEAEKKNVYTTLTCCATGNGCIMPLDDDSYGGIVLCGVIPSIKDDGVLDLFRILKPGGLLVNVCRLNCMAEASWFDGVMSGLIEAGGVAELEVQVPQQMFYLQNEAIVHVYRKMPNRV